MTNKSRWLVLSLAIALGGCSKGGGGGSSTPAPVAPSYKPGTFAPAATFKDLCAAPRTGLDPETSAPWPDKPGTTLDENNWLRSWSNDLYLWYNEIVDRNPANYSTADYFNLLKTTATTTSGAARDKFHFTYDTNTWRALSQSGETAGYGATFTIISSKPPRSVVVAYTEPGSPATSSTVALARGASIITVDGVDLANSTTQADIDVLNAGLFPSNSGETHHFTVQDMGSSSTRDITMTSKVITETPVQHVEAIDLAGEKVGYLVFNDHIATAEKELVDAINQLKTDGVTDLFLDMRYNGGGYLAIANELAYMIAGPVANGQTFEQLQFNDKHPNIDPVTGAALTPTLFSSKAEGFSVTSGTALPSLNLSRVFVLTGPGTCSASESVINGLRGIGIDVYQIGSTTCGKPYGFYPQDNCGTTYFSIEFRGINAAGFGDYTDGFSPENTASTAGVPLPGCQVADDFTHDLGDVAEGRLAAAIQYRADSSCPTPTSLGQRALGVPGLAPLSAVDGTTPKPVWRENRILGHPG